MMLRHIRLAPKGRTLHFPSSLAFTLSEWVQQLYHLGVPRRVSRIGGPNRICECRYPLYSLCSPQTSPYDMGVSTVSIASQDGPMPLEGNTTSSLVGHDNSAVAIKSASKGRERVRRLLYLQCPWRVRASHVHSPNSVPQCPPCYRCDICGGFQDVRDDDNDVETARYDVAADSTLEGTHQTAFATAVPSALSAASHTVVEAQGMDEEEADLGAPVSTDIVNTIMDDAEVAQVRYVDPFLVEVSGRLPIGLLSRQFAMQFQAQLQRCGVTLRELVQRSASALTTSAEYSASYEAWVERQVHAKRQPAAEQPRSFSGRLHHLRNRFEMFDTAAYAVRFAVAAYGLPYEFGYFNSIAGIAKLQAEPHRRYTCATSEEQMESMRRVLQGEESGPLMEFAASRYTLRVGQPCYTVILDHERHRVVLTFRGSLTLADAVLDVSEGYAVVDLGRFGAALPLKIDTLVSGYFMQMFGADKCCTCDGTATDDRIHAVKAGPSQLMPTRLPLGFYLAVREAAQDLLPALETIHLQYPTYSLMVTGHSLGGIEASLFHILYCMNTTKVPLVPFAKVQTVTFGAAPVVEECVLSALNQRLAEEERAHGSQLLSFVYGKDIVSRLQVRSLWQTLMGSTQRDSLISFPQAGAGARVAARGLREASDDVLPTLALPGTVLHLPATRRRTSLNVPEGTPWRSQTILSAVAVYHHFPIHYARSVNRLLVYYSRQLKELQHQQLALRIEA